MPECHSSPPASESPNGQLGCITESGLPPPRCNIAWRSWPWYRTRWLASKVTATTALCDWRRSRNTLLEVDLKIEECNFSLCTQKYLREFQVASDYVRERERENQSLRTYPGWQTRVPGKSPFTVTPKNPFEDPHAPAWYFAPNARIGSMLRWE